MSQSAQATAANLDFSILDGTLDDIEDLPGFLVFPSGAYLVELHQGLNKKAIANHPAVEMAMKCIEVKELADPNDADKQPKIGDVCTIAFMLDNEFGRGNLKKVLEPIGERLGIKANSQIVEASKGIKALVVIKKTENKEKGKEYANLLRFVPV
jgi:hypothetical protein